MCNLENVVQKYHVMAALPNIGVSNSSSLNSKQEHKADIFLEVDKDRIPIFVENRPKFKNWHTHA